MANTSMIHGIDWANLDVPLIPQITNKFCWAACLEMTAATYYNCPILEDKNINKISAKNQNKLGASYQHFFKDTSKKNANKKPSVLLSNKKNEFVNVLYTFFKLESYEAVQLTIETIKEQIVVCKPIILIKQLKNGFVYHAQVITGWEKIDEENIYLIMSDPLETVDAQLNFTKKATKYKMKFSKTLISKYWVGNKFIVLTTAAPSGKTNAHTIGDLPIQNRIGKIKETIKQIKISPNISQLLEEQLPENEIEREAKAEIETLSTEAKTNVEQKNFLRTIEIGNVEALPMNPKPLIGFEKQLFEINEAVAKLKTVGNDLTGIAHFVLDEEKLLSIKIKKTTKLEDLVKDTIWLDVNEKNGGSGTITYEKIEENWEVLKINGNFTHSTELNHEDEMIRNFEYIEFAILGWGFYRFQNLEGKWLYLPLSDYRYDISLIYSVIFSIHTTVEETTFISKISAITKTHLK